MRRFNRDSMRTFLRSCKVSALERGVLSIYALQTQGEQSANRTLARNHMGFSKKTDKIGTKMAKYLLSGRHMVNQHYIEEARSVCSEHARQLAEIANGGKLREIRDAQFAEWGCGGMF